MSNARGLGLMCALDLPTAELRGKVVRRCFEDGMIVLPCGPRSVRFRPTLSVTAEAIAEGVTRLERAIVHAGESRGLPLSSRYFLASLFSGKAPWPSPPSSSSGCPHAARLELEGHAVADRVREPGDQVRDFRSSCDQLLTESASTVSRCACPSLPMAIAATGSSSTAPPAP